MEHDEVCQFPEAGSQGVVVFANSFPKHVQPPLSLVARQGWNAALSERLPNLQAAGQQVARQLTPSLADLRRLPLCNLIVEYARRTGNFILSGICSEFQELAHLNG